MPSKVKFIAVVIISGKGEVVLAADENHIYTDPVNIQPSITIVGDKLSEEEHKTVCAMILHQVVQAALSRVQMTGMAVETTPVNTQPADGEKN